LKHLPLHTVPAPNPKVKGFRKFFTYKSDIGILRLAGDQDHYIVADLIVSHGNNKIAELCVFSTASIPRPALLGEPSKRPSRGRAMAGGSPSAG
jgi:hypothetical protein